MIESVTMYRAICDGCGDCAQDGGDYYAWAEPDQAVEEAEWREIDGKHYCDDCWKWDEETDQPVAIGRDSDRG